MGLYRTGTFWAMDNFGVTPDVIVFGKAFTNGLNPLSGVWAREELINPSVFPPGSTHSTFSSNPLGTAVALEVMKMVEEEDYGSMVKEKGAYFLEGLKDLKSRYPIIGDVDGLGMALRIEICRPDGFTPDRDMTDRIVEEGLQCTLENGDNTYGLVLDVGGYYKNVLTLAPALTISRAEMDLAIALLDQLFRRVS
jgi:4-aminobutyrate aminotransferase-like enzyme